MKKLVLVALILVPFIASCATTADFSRISLGMSRSQVRQAIGAPDAIRGNLMSSKHGQTIEIWEYRRYKEGISLNEIKVPTEYWFYFVDGQLDRWGEAGDWKRLGK